MIVVDTDVMVDVLRGYPPAVAWLESLGDAEIVLPGSVAMELIQGCRNSHEQRRLEERVAPYAVLWPEPEGCDQALATFARLHLSSNVGVLDVLIAQTAIGLRTPLYTFNAKHYRDIEGLKTVEPYSRS
ncbi:MAG: PIN domain-containing protein [Clostridia bacterium]|jgi:predicted nucleic acid-binding protein|nr:PIN domain-containing protein [Clostridia bacterium]MDH7572570.1 PIN domain-containing protein [Clostridia bacterium]